MSEYHSGVIFIYTAFFTSDEDKEDGVGTPLMFAITKDITPQVSIEALKA